MEQALAIEREASTHLLRIAAATGAGQSPVQRFYAKGVVLITGGSGYLGKHLLEKLFRSCEIRKAYVLLRPKKGKRIEERLTEILQDPAYDSLHYNQPDFKQRIVAVEGDIGKLRFDLSEENRRDIIENVTMIFHVAATVKFDEDLKVAALTNVRGTREIIHLAKECSQLRSFVYVSTAFSNANQQQCGRPVFEKFYPVPVYPAFLIHMAETVSNVRVQEMTAKLTQGWYNTYTFTKAVAEDLIRTECAGLPACIVRPAIVISAYHEPIPGWTDKRCVQGTGMGVGLSLIMGLNHVLLVVRHAAINLVPIDIVNNAIIVAAMAASKQNTIMIYNVSCNPNFLWEHIMAVFHKTVSNIPTPKNIGHCFAVLVSTDLMFNVLTLLLHYIPGAVIDVCYIVTGKKARLIQIYNRLHKMSKMFKWFVCQRWYFDDKNTQTLYRIISENDRVIFNFNRDSLDLQKMVVIWTLGLRKFVLDDELKGNDVARKKQFLFKLFTLGFLLIYFIILFWLGKISFGLVTSWWFGIK